MSPYSVIGNRVPGRDALDKVTGRARYVADVDLPGMAHAKILTSPHPHARILRLDTSKAQALQGVVAVVSAEDVPSQRASAQALSPHHNPFARDKALFFGQPVAAVAATTLEIAEEAIGLIQVEYEELPVVADVHQATEPDAPLVHPDLHTDGLAGRADVPSNVALVAQFERGDTAAGFEEADVVVERSFRTQTVHHGYMEPRAAVAEVGPDGKVTVWASTQGIFSLRQTLAEVLGLPLPKVRIIPMEVGGAFGAKLAPVETPICAVLAQKARRPVKLVLNRTEELTSTRPAPGASATIKIGATREGLLTAVSGSVTYDSGAFPNLLAAGGVIMGLAQYRIPNLMVDGYVVVTNKPPVASYRAPGAPQSNFAVESVMDELAETLGLPPLEFRLRNVAAEGDPMPGETLFPKSGFRETIERMAQHPAFKNRPEGRNRGRGIACGFWMGGVGSSAAHVNVNADGSVALVIGSIDLTGTRTTLAQIVAEELALPLDAVSVVTADTDAAPFSDITAGSRTMHQMGTAVYRACQDVKAQMAQRAAATLGADVSNIEFADGKLQLRDDPEKHVTLADLARASIRTADGALTGRGAVGVPERIPTFSVHMVDVEVDPETGKCRVLAYTIAQDVGHAVNPLLVEGQMQGAAAQGIGWALSEGYVFDAGVPRNTTLLDYRLPTSVDVPFVDPLIVEVESTTTLYGIKGMAETPLVPAMAAVANAIHDAVGVRMTTLPMTPEAVLETLKAG